jgi:hypothetical protein
MIITNHPARMVELVDTPDLKSCAFWACGFKSRSGYKKQSENQCESDDLDSVFYFTPILKLTLSLYLKPEFLLEFQIHLER